MMEGFELFHVFMSLFLLLCIQWPGGVYGEDLFSMLSSRYPGCDVGYVTSHTEQPQVLTTPNYPSAYPSNMDRCDVLLTMDDSEMGIYLDHVDMNCGTDYLEISYVKYLGEDRFAEDYIDSFCNVADDDSRDVTRYFDSQMFYIRYVSDGSDEGQGFKITYFKTEHAEADAEDHWKFFHHWWVIGVVAGGLSPLVGCLCYLVLRHKQKKRQQQQAALGPQPMGNLVVPPASGQQYTPGSYPTMFPSTAFPSVTSSLATDSKPTFQPGVNPAFEPNTLNTYNGVQPGVYSGVQPGVYTGVQPGSYVST